MRVSGRSPAARATRSACNPAQPTRKRAATGWTSEPSSISIVQPSDDGVARPTRTPVRTSPPALPTWLARVRATPAKSARPVEGTWSAAMQATWGSRSRASSVPNSVTATPLARDRSARACRRGISTEVVATTNFPQRSWAIPCWAQKSTIRSPPLTARAAFSEPGV